MLFICFRRRRSWHSDSHYHRSGFCCWWSHCTCFGHLCCRCFQVEVRTDYTTMSIALVVVAAVVALVAIEFYQKYQKSRFMPKLLPVAQYLSEREIWVKIISNHADMFTFSRFPVERFSLWALTLTSRKLTMDFSTCYVSATARSETLTLTFNSYTGQPIDSDRKPKPEFRCGIKLETLTARDTPIGVWLRP